MSAIEIANQLVAAGKGIMAADRPSPAFYKLLEDEGISADGDSYRNWSELLFLTPGLNEHVSGIIMTDEQVRLTGKAGGSLIEQVIERGMIPGISPFKGMVHLAGSAGETVGGGLDGLRERLAEYAALGVGFSKWRAAFQIGPGTPSTYAIEANAYVMAQVAALSQEAGIVPIVEPEVMLLGDHSIERCFAVTERVLSRTFEALYLHRADLEHTLVKASMVLSGNECPQQADVDAVAEQTVKVFRRAIPAAIPGIVFLSGGQSDYHATANLNAMNANYDLPWKLSFSYARALQREPMTIWRNRPENVPAAQAALHHRAKMNGLAALGLWTADLEGEAAAP
ncbi:MAG: fructose-bisphosphate aldolase class I [Chloroflexota bacterium]|nr:fructose-bisphosphate aldolase class I [Chloroflexota bacterium]